MEDAEQPLLSSFQNFKDHIHHHHHHQRHVGNSKDIPSTSSSSLIIGDEGEIGIILGIRDLYFEFFNEWKKLMYLAGPSIFTLLCQYAIGALTLAFAGHLGTTTLAAISVENSVVAGFGYGLLMGMGSALETLCGQAYGANQHNMLGIYMQRAWIVLNTVAIGMVFVFIFSTPILNFLGQDSNISREVGKFALWMIPQQFAYAMMIPLTKFLQAQSKVLEMALISVVALCLNAMLGWILMVKMRMGLAAAALMLNVSWWFITGAQFLYVMVGSCGRAWSGFSWKAFSNLSGFVKLSISSAVMLSLEIWYLMALTLVAGHLENAEVSLDALSICVNIIGWSGMVGLGFNVAISVRVSNELGCGHYKTAKFSVMVAGMTSYLCGLAFAIILFLYRKQFPALFTNSTEVQLLVEDLTPLLGVSVIFTCVQYALSGVVIGAGWQNFVGYINAGCYFLLGVPCGILMCYKFNMGVKGIWYGMVIGLCLQTCLIFWVVCITNWRKEAQVAEERLKQWGGEMDAQLDEEK
ncbi:OLC1v1028399C1 [Oldenlandia corymbosa var. corymbosa]|uniref:Protein DETOXIFICATION n=1 Tax=Oldenlandia corymbosa var. corymbosa TaxID=529605 RepID=A0AAV1CBL4_OLDCO|nr:OLC1v1028399C1 [Oldenlandia corymbosa var. corymbosa]